MWDTWDMGISVKHTQRKSRLRIERQKRVKEGGGTHSLAWIHNFREIAKHDVKTLFAFL